DEPLDFRRLRIPAIDLVPALDPLQPFGHVSPELVQVLDGPLVEATVVAEALPTHVGGDIGVLDDFRLRLEEAVLVQDPIGRLETEAGRTRDSHYNLSSFLHIRQAFCDSSPETGYGGGFFRLSRVCSPSL